MDVVFAVLPFADVRRPAIGVSLLQAAIQRLGFRSKVEYFNLDFAELIGANTYQYLTHGLPAEALLGEWFFADLVFGTELPDADDYLKRILIPYAPTRATLNAITEARTRRDIFIHSCLDRLKQLQPHVVGFTTTFHQTCACLALAKRLKELKDAPITVFGGANCEAEMGFQMLRSFPWIDFVSTGEADKSFPAFLTNPNGPLPPGIIGRGTPFTRSEPIHDLDSLPYPDYSDYFRRASHPKEDRAIQIETSRGCWWGAKHHCTFCGLNGGAMVYRSKSPQRVLEELTYLSHTYTTKHIESVDNILDTRYIQSLFPKLIERELNLNLFFEVKSNLRYDQLVTLRTAGVTAIQPGIESFSNDVLRRMQKGCTGLQNIQLLRWSSELGIDVMWNILAGFPGESPADYDQQATLLPLLTHLPPPASSAVIRMDRFSPLFTKATEYGLKRIRPATAYFYVYPLSGRELSELAYFFEFDYEDNRNPDDYLKRIKQETRVWWSARGAARLNAEVAGNGLRITDTRTCALTPTHHLQGLSAAVYEQCDSIQNLAALKRRFHTEAALKNVLDDFINANLMVEMEGHFLSLAVFRNRHIPPSPPSATYALPQTQTPDSLLRVV